jgi:hypothetical protein
MTSLRRFFLCCMAAAAIVFFFLVQEQRTAVSDWTTNNARSVSVASSPGDAESTQEKVEEPEKERPLLHTIIGDFEKNIKGDVEFLLDFAIIGHPKTATTFTMHWLASHPEIQMHEKEIHSLRKGRPAEMVSRLYPLPAGSKYQHGYKAPRDIYSIQALNSIAEYWPDCKLVVGVRHPVTWFQSFYNYRSLEFDMPPADSLIGKCSPRNKRVCTDAAAFHLNLSLLGKTNENTLEEIKLLMPLPPEVPALAPLHNRVFLYDMSQLRDKDEARSYQYRRDLGNFLGLQQELAPIVQNHTNKNAEKHLDICEDRYRPLRRALMDIAKPASEWIRTYFMQSPEVFVSSPEYFNELLLEWLEDPCDKKSHENDPERRRLSL